MQCSLAFKTSEKLALHSSYHVIRDQTRCKFCARSFRTILALLRHVEGSHEVGNGGDDEVAAEEVEQYKQSLINHPLLLIGDTACNKGNEDDQPMDTTGSNYMEASNEEQDKEGDTSPKEKVDNTLMKKIHGLLPHGGGSMFGIGGNRTKIDKSGIKLTK